MANRPKDKGTWAETQVAEYLQLHGWPYAERRALAGITDKGDITGCPGLAWEVKYANAGIRMGTWIAETYVERENAKADHGVLVIKPKGRGAVNTGKWLAVMLAWDLEALVAKRDPRVEFSSGDPEVYSGTKVLADLRSLETSTREGVQALVRRPPGTKEKPDEWYMILTLEDITTLLRSAGYGSPLVDLLVEDLGI